MEAHKVVQPMSIAAVAKNRLGKCLLILVWLLYIAPTARAIDPPDPLGATLHGDGTTTFRLWAPFVDSVGVRINGGAVVPMTKEPGHADPDDTTWTGKVSGLKAGDHYRYAIVAGGVQHEFNDPRAQQLTGFDLPDGYGLPGNDDKPQSVIIDPTFTMPAFTEPTFNAMVIYELHVGTFNQTFKGVAKKLGYLQDLGVNAIEVLPIVENVLATSRSPNDYDWGYDPAHLFAIKRKYGSPREFKEFVKQCHQRNIAVIVDVVYNHLATQNLLLRFGGFSPSQIPAGIYFYGGDRLKMDFGLRPDFGRPQVRQYLNDNALLLLRDYGVDGLRFDDTIAIRSYGDHVPIPDGAGLLRDINTSYRTTDPKQPGKISIAEDLQGSGDVTSQSLPVGLEFNSQWDDGMVGTLRNQVTKVNDSDRDLGAIKGTLETRFGNDVFSRVIYTEDHDQVGHPEKNQIRLPALIDGNDHESIFARKRSTLAAAIMLTSPGIPMIFQGQEMLETRPFTFDTPANVDFTRATGAKYKGIVQLYHDLIALRRNLAGKTVGLTGQHLNVFHEDDGNKILAYHRWENGGAGDDVVVVANFSNSPQKDLNIGFPRSGMWHVLFNSGAAVYDAEYTNGDSFDTMANPGDKDGMNFNANVSVGAYSLVIFSQ
jgi:1,4-alpha-glucan branching enzyme